eukprot:TRINITY_DN6732_c0_g1_i2.p1 TRINITY_DN6732_c0_g1~~TRINITY_DN6732_c0_g1_i2.p1  ORF type:complete len:180 (+),score=23.87 TRINITY_DN6732_c0_g1_i2:563-1102(+)
MRYAELFDGRAVKIAQLASIRDWDVMLQRHRKWTELTGGQQVPRSIGPLGAWAHTQRSARRKGSLAEERRAAAEAAGLKWDLKTGMQVELNKRIGLLKWEPRFEALKRFQKANGGSLNPTKAADIQLYRWCMHQRGAYRNEQSLAAGKGLVTGCHRITPEGVARLKNIGFDFYSGPGSG